MNSMRPSIAVLGASGLIGEAVATVLSTDGFSVIPIARRFTRSQRAVLGPASVEKPVVEVRDDVLCKMLGEHQADVVVNCVGVLQDGPRGGTDAVHRAFVEHLVKAIGLAKRDILLIHISIPGIAEDDRTAFARSKREAEGIISAANIPFIILRPGFVLAPAAYGGSALVRALAALPLALPHRESSRPFATTDVTDIARSIAFAARRWSEGEKNWNCCWDVMADRPETLGSVVEAFRRHFGGPRTCIRIPSPFLSLGAKTGDIVSRLGWSPPIRSTALCEMRRGVTGDPTRWIAATGIEPTPLNITLRRLAPTVQEKWFARLYLFKALILFSLVIFWIVSGLIALTVSFQAAAAILRSHGFPPALANTTTVISSLVDIAVGLAIAQRRTCAVGLMAGVLVSLGYMAGAAVLTPDLWIEPLGALVKTGPAIVLMLVARVILGDR